MSKSSKIILLVLTVAFVGITVWRVVDWSIRQREASLKQVVEITLSGPDEIEAGKFDESAYTMTIKHVDGSTEDKAFYAVYFDDASYKALFEGGEHTLGFTYENCAGTFDVTVIGDAEAPERAANVWVILLIIAGVVIVVAAVTVAVLILIGKRRGQQSASAGD